MEFADRLRADLESKKANAVTKAIGELAKRLGYELKPPFTELVNLRALEEDGHFAVHFSAKLHLHYSSHKNEEGLVFTLEFSGEGNADSPSPPVDELFAVGSIDSFIVYGYGDRWIGRRIRTPSEFANRLEVTSPNLNQIETDDFLRAIGAET
jgi:hypothetical protein